jgi:hypothetical protein
MAVTNTNESTRFMVESFSDMNAINSNTAFQGSFFGIPETGAVTKYITDKKNVEIDIKRNNGNRVAQMIHRGTGADDDTSVKKSVADRFSNVSFAWPLIESKGAINSSELLDRAFGKDPYESQDAKDNLVAKARDIHHDHFNQQINTMEFLARESVFNGSHPAILGTSNTGYIYDFGRNANLNISAGAVWSTASTDILGDMDSMVDALQQYGSLFDKEYGFLCDGTTFGGIRNNTQIKAEADIKKYSFGELGEGGVPTKFSRYVNNGFSPRGWVQTDKGRIIWIFTYDLTFIDHWTTPGSDIVTPWVPANTGLMFHPSARCDKYVGPMDRLPFTASESKWYQERFGFSLTNPTLPANIQNPGVVDPRMFYTWGGESDDMKSISLTTQSSVILPTTRTDAFCKIDSL